LPFEPSPVPISQINTPICISSRALNFKKNQGSTM
jgi:hypothetical protein